MFDPTQTQPLTWRMQDGQPKPWGELSVESTGRKTPSFDDSPPDRLPEGGFRLRGRIGSGRLGAIYEAQDELSQISGSRHFAAVQLIDDRIAMRPAFEDDFEQGAMQLKSVVHPNIVRLLEYGRDRDRFYLVHELLESASLRFVLNDAGVLPLPETTAVLRAVGDALQYLHAKGMVHGNLRPEHVLVTFGYEVKLLDIVPTGWVIGPTDALGVPARAPDKRDDVFGLGCLTYEMLSGRHPFNGNTAQEAHRAGLEAEPIEGLSEPQWRALEGALAVHRDDRTPNVAQFLEDFGVESSEKLKAIVETAPERAVPPPTYTASDPLPALVRPVAAERAAPSRPKRRGVAGQLIFLLLVIAGGFAAWYYQEPLRQFASDLASEVEMRMNREAPAPTTAAKPAQAPLEMAPPVTDDAPATVLAPGAMEPDTTVSIEPVPFESPPVATVAPEPEPQPATSTEAAASAAVAAPASATTTGPTRFEFAQSAMSVHEGDIAARVTIRRSGDLSKPAEVTWWTEGGSAVADADYADLGSRIELFAPGEASRTIYIPLANDSAREPAKGFSIVLGRGQGDIIARARVDIVDDD